MKALVLKRLREISLSECDEPRIEQSRDAIVRVTTTAVCGSDLHIFHGRDQGVRMGTIMGHEFVGIVEEVGEGVKNFAKGDRVVSPFSINCGECFFCLRDLPARCVKSFCFGFVNEEGAGLQGAQAEYVRVPLASSTLVKIPDGPKDEEVLFLGDIFSTAYSCAEAAQIRKGDTVVVIGCGPVGLLCILAARLFQPNMIVAVDSIDYRLEKAGS
ncbi:MAG TPA: alcohol dehydrogenase catalytic domain-containing protein, partial [Acidobacteriota bacterium]